MKIYSSDTWPCTSGGVKVVREIDIAAGQRPLPTFTKLTNPGFPKLDIPSLVYPFSRPFSLSLFILPHVLFIQSLSFSPPYTSIIWRHTTRRHFQDACQRRADQLDQNILLARIRILTWILLQSIIHLKYVKHVSSSSTRGDLKNSSRCSDLLDPFLLKSQ